VSCQGRSNKWVSFRLSAKAKIASIMQALKLSLAMARGEQDREEVAAPVVKAKPRRHLYRNINYTQMKIRRNRDCDGWSSWSGGALLLPAS